MSTPAEILDFWFRESGPSRWFERDAAFDELIRSRFGDDAEAAAAGRYDEWADHPEGALALIILLDQFPRNLYRGQARAFATDAKALATARAGIEAGHDLELPAEWRVFFYMPFEHSENIEDQRQSVRLFAERTEQAIALDYACLHHVIIYRFGRFPHRNAILGRETTEAEAAFLKEPYSSF